MEKFCRYCGAEFACEPEKYPKTCVGCKQMTWKNPLPVAVLLQPVHDTDNDRIGILIGKRGIPPFKGSWALIGGHIDPEDLDVIHAARREFLEETGFQPANYDQMKIVSSYSDSRYLLLFVEAGDTIPLEALDEFKKNFECPEVRVAWEPEQLCFISHTNALTDWFFPPILY